MFFDHPRAAERLASDVVIWMTTVSPDGQPQTSPVWYIIEDGEFLIYSLPDTARVRNITTNRKVALNLDGNGRGGDIVTIEGEARIDPSASSASQHPAYLAKYGSLMERNGWTPDWFAGRYSSPIRVTFTRGRAW